MSEKKHQRFLESSCSTRFRDLAIDAAIHAIIRVVDPTISNADIQRRAETQVYRSGYIANLDGEPICAIELDGSRRFSLSLLMPNGADDGQLPGGRP